MSGMHKEMAGAFEKGDFGVGGLPGCESHNHVSPETGSKGELADHERGAPMGVKGRDHAYDRQAAPDHGPATDHFSRGGKV